MSRQFNYLLLRSFQVLSFKIALRRHLFSRQIQRLIVNKCLYYLLNWRLTLHFKISLWLLRLLRLMMGSNSRILFTLWCKNPNLNINTNLLTRWISHTMHMNKWFKVIRLTVKIVQLLQTLHVDGQLHQMVLKFHSAKVSVVIVITLI